MNIAGLHPGGSEPVPGEDRPELVPCSFAQRQLWLLERLEPGNAAYLVSGVTRIAGRLDVDALRGAFDDCVRRHESLRTAIVEIDGEPWQCIEPRSQISFKCVDLSAADAHDPDVIIARAIAFAHTPLPLGVAPLARVLLMRIAEDDFVLSLAIHHIVFDGWSMIVLLRDLAAFYAHRCDLRAPEPPELAIQFADFSEWQREQVAMRAETVKAYWQQQLRGLEPLRLPTDRPHDVPRSAAAGAVNLHLGTVETAALRNLARRHGVTHFVVLLAAFKLLLWRLCAQTDIAVGVPTARRDRAELQGLVGYVANTFILRTRIPVGLGLDALLASVRDAALGALGHADLPLDEIIQELMPERRQRQELPFRVLFAMQPDTEATISAAGVRITPVDIPPAAPKADLLVEVTERAATVDIRLEFDAALFDRETIAFHAGIYRDIIARMTEHPAASLEQLAAVEIVAANLRARDKSPPSGDVIDFPGRFNPVDEPAPAIADDVDESAGDDLRPLPQARQFEQTLVEIWTELFPRARGEAGEHFLELGGSSLLAAHLVAHVRARLGIEIPLATMFEQPTFGDFVRAVAAGLSVPAAESAIEPVSRFSALALSYAQTRMWFMQQLEPSSTAYTLFGAVRIEGALDAERLRRAIEALHVRHEPLRTKFREIAGRPLQIIVPVVDVELPIDDLTRLDGKERDAEVARIARNEGCRPFDLNELPVLRTRLLRLTGQEHVLLASLHHIAGDAWSIRLLWRDLVELYAADAGERMARLPELQVQYADYAQWQVRMLGAAELDRLLAYWRRRLADLPTLDLPTDHSRPALQNERGARFEFAFPEALTARIGELALRLQATRFMILAAGFQTLVGRICGADDVPLGVPVACRDRAEVQDLIGCFVNLVVLRGDLSGDPSFRELVGRVRETALEAFAHQHLPFEKLVEAIQPERDLSRHPLFQVLFDFQDAVRKDTQSGTLRMSPLEIDAGVSQFDLSVYLDGGDGAGPIRGAVVYRTDLFDAATVERMAGSFVRLMDALVGEPDAAIASHDIMSAGEREQLRIWNDTRQDYGAPALLDDLIVAAARARPQSIAISAETETLSYSDLLRASDAMARRLRALGARPDSIVAVCLERGLAMPVALLAILRSGAAYLPIDPELPAGRLAFMLEDAAPLVVLTSERLRERLPPGTRVADAEAWLATALRNEAEPLGSIDGRSDQDLAYVIYTSGSTGQPKGAMIPHSGIVNRLRWMQAAYGLGADDSVLQKTPYAFDVSVWEFFWPMMTGARLVMAAPGAHRDPNYIAGIIERAGITTVHFVPSMLDAFLPCADPVRCRSLRRVIVSGEALSQELRDRFLDAGLPAELHNLYGPTEASVDVTAWPCGPGERGRSSPIGRPIGNVRIHILDSQGRETGIGIPGEICIGGVALARGYLNRPQLTRERFVPDPFSSPGARLYRTGDRGRIRSDGVIEYLGRADFQIKLRGNRIELGEIEAVMRRCAGVRDAAAIVSGTSARDQKIVLFVTSHAGVLDVDALRRHAGAHLPSYMVPAGIIELPSLPLSVNGKLDRRALADIEPPQPPARSAPPRNEAERRVSAVWRRVLDRGEIGIHDNFFDVGGNSLLLVQVHVRLRDAFERQLSLMDMFRMPTVASLAAYLSADSPDPVEAPRTQMPPAAPFRAASRDENEAIAIIGMAGRFPGASSVDEFWENLLSGRESILRVDREMLRAEGVDPDIFTDPNYVPAVGALGNIDLFDAEFFGLGPAEAARLDPQGRLILECASEALEDAGIARAMPRTGVFTGGAVSSYALQAHAAGLANAGGSTSAAYQLMLGNDKDYLSSRVSYRLGLRGPSIVVQTACSTSLVAVSLAVRSLLDHDCDVALAGGVSVSVPHRVGYLQEEGAITSPRGRCRAFDAEADGTVPGNGVGLVVLKRLRDALRDRDVVRAVIRGSAVNNDGDAKLGFTSPNPEGQAEVIAAALAAASLSPAAIGYVEAHGTGTPLGDQVELSALARVFDDPSMRPVIGSLKTNVGHLDAAAGVAGLIKATLAVEHGVIPPTLHFTTPNALLRTEAAGFAINAEPRPWRDTQSPRRAGVSSFGIGGTNAHVVIEQAPPSDVVDAPAGTPEIIVLSARTPSALQSQAERLRAALQRPANLASVAWTLQSGRREQAWRLAIVANTAADAISRLAQARLPEQPASSVADCCFMFPGQGTQQPGMGRALYQTQPHLRADVERCLAQLDDVTARSVRAAAFGPDEVAPEALRQTGLAQPALFVLQYALARLLMSFGITPRAMIGHSLGEFVAATLAGVFQLGDALRLITLRARLMQAMPPGAMAGLLCREAEISARMPSDLSIAACNEPGRTIVAGPAASLAAFCADMAEKGIESVPLQVSHAFHSAMMDPVVAPLADALKHIRLRPPSIQFASTVTGAWITADEATDPAYWAQHLRRTVRFSAALATLAADHQSILVEVGPGRTLTSIAIRHGIKAAWPALPLTGGDTDAVQSDLMAMIAQLWERGLTIDWSGLHPDPKPQKVRLPTYPFERRRFWLEGAPRAARPRPLDEPRELSVYAPAWRPAASRLAPRPGATSISILCDASADWSELAAALRAAAVDVAPVDVIVGDAVAGGLVLVPLPRDLALTAMLMRVAGIVRQMLDAGVRDLVFLTFAGEEVTGAEDIDAGAAGAAAAVLAVAQELTGLNCRVIDLDPATLSQSLAILAREILFGGETQCAIRGRRRFVVDSSQLPLPRKERAFRDRGVYLITGGGGALGRALASHLMAHYRARLVLLTRRSACAEAPAGFDPQDTPIVLTGDVADPACAQAAVSAALGRFGRLDGVFHAAGITGNDAVEPVLEMTDARTGEIVHPKLGGTAALAEALAGLSPDFILLCSSISTLLGGFGFAAYAAANRAMEVLAAREADATGQRWISVAFDGLGFGQPSRGAAAAPTISPDAALDIIERIIASDLEGRLSVVAGDLAQRRTMRREAASRAVDTSAAPQPDRNARLDGTTEELVSAIWSSELGQNVNGRDDDFFELGGDSLAAISVIARLRAETGLPLTFRLAMQANTVARMAALLDGLRAAGQADPIAGPAADIEEGEL
jgi:amino acid adenylation domain-containing protein